MKKSAVFISAILCVIMLATSVSAAATEDAYTIYRRAMKKLEAAGALKTTTDIKLYEAEDPSYYDTFKVTTTQSRDADDKLLLEAILEDNSGYDNIEKIADMYYKDGYMYYCVQDGGDPTINRKTAIDEKGAVMAAYGLDTRFGRDVLKDATLTPLEDGGYTITCMVSGRKYSGMLENAVGISMLSYYEENADRYEDIADYKVKSSDITYTMMIGSNGALQSYRMSYSSRITMSEYGETEDVIVRWRAVGKISPAGEINFPNGMESYASIPSFA